MVRPSRADFRSIVVSDLAFGRYWEQVQTRRLRSSRSTRRTLPTPSPAQKASLGHFSTLPTTTRTRPNLVARKCCSTSSRTRLRGRRSACSSSRQRLSRRSAGSTDTGRPGSTATTHRRLLLFRGTCSCRPRAPLRSVKPPRPRPSTTRLLTRSIRYDRTGTSTSPPARSTTTSSEVARSSTSVRLPSFISLHARLIDRLFSFDSHAHQQAPERIQALGRKPEADHGVRRRPRMVEPSKD